MDYPPLVPYLVIDTEGDAVDWYRRALGAEQVMRLDGPAGSIAHCELRLPSGGTVFLSSMAPDAGGEGYRTPRALGATSVVMHLTVDDVDAATDRAREAGAVVEQEPQDWFYGDRSSTVADPWGHRWTLTRHVRDVSEQEMREAMEQMTREMEQGSSRA